MKRGKKTGLVVIILLWVAMAFQLPKSEPTKIPPLVKEKIDQEVAQYYAERLRVCKLDALLKAEDYVDSIIVNRINLNIMNGKNFPNRPARPPSPGSILLDDTTVIAPIFKK
ncbi:MAG: hypothetical protein IPH94_10490 [Saprospiraceae bacterium]|nr:hypothetical protein [Saprospiraceae bacterium]MBK7790301.1 hypothetical protein [Saprospiraceae bacterium]MBK8851426.1 hypothetical protein [Saprospiraceae bacterium]